MPEHFVHHKNTFTQGELEAKTFQKSQNVFVKCRIMKSLSAKPSLLHFLCWKSCSLRAGFTKQTPSLTLPCVLAVCCETELLCGTLKWLDCRVNLNAMIFHLLLFQMSFPVPCLELEQVGKQGGTQVTPECKCNLVLACHNKNNKRSCPCQLKHVSTSFTISCMKKGTLQWNCQHKFSRPFERSNQATSSNRRTCLRKNSFWEPWFSCLLFDSLALFFLVMLIATGLTQVQEGEERVDKATSRRLASAAWKKARFNGTVNISFPGHSKEAIKQPHRIGALAFGRTFGSLGFRVCFLILWHFSFSSCSLQRAWHRCRRVRNGWTKQPPADLQNGAQQKESTDWCLLFCGTVALDWCWKWMCENQN